MPGQLFQHYVSPLAAHRLLFYGLFSTGMVMAVIANALKKYSSFYSVMVYLSRSNGSAIALANFTVLLALLFGRVMQQVFFGPLRSTEVERLYDRIWFFLTESLLAFTIFRDEFGFSFALMFGVLLFTKCFHWLLSDRIEWMDQRPYPGPPLIFHIRVNTLMAILWSSDFCIFVFIIDNMLTDGVGSIVLFASEYAILMASVLNSMAKYLIAIIELRRASRRGGENAPPWEDKSMYVFYVELATDFLKLVTYLTFFMLVLRVYGLPLNIVRDVYITARSFIMKARDLMRYRTATRNMDQRYPNATEEEMNAMSDRTCIICREEMVIHTNNSQGQGAILVNGEANPPVSRDGPNTTPKKLVCGHVFHFYCLRSWLERQQSCPTCRRSVLDNSTPGSGTARQGQAPAPPQPGAVPRNPGVVAPQGNGAVQQAPGPNADGAGVGVNFGGLFGRLMGVAGAPPIIPGQFVNAPAPAADAGGGAAQAGVNYGIPGQANGNLYMGANGWAGQQQQYGLGLQQHRPREQEQQPRVFQGFHGPDGVWQPWPLVEGDAPVQIQNENEAPPSQQTDATSSIPDSQGDHASDTHAVSEPTGDSGDATPRSAREAAALAALRRNNGSASTSTPKPGPSSSSAGEKSHTSAEIRRAQVLPPLIPLYVPSAANQRANFTSQATSASTSGQLRTQRIGNANYFTAGEALANRRNLGLLRASALPPSLTEEQLLRMDRLTREAIDERLRVLEDVQRVSARCVDELLRVRSILPRSSAIRGSGSGSGSSTSTGVEPESGSPSSSPTIGSSNDGDGTLFAGSAETPRVVDAADVELNGGPGRTTDVVTES